MKGRTYHRGTSGWSMGRGLCVLALLLFLLVASCGRKGTTNRHTLNSRLPTPNSQIVTLEQALEEVKRVEAPEGADEELFNTLKAELEKKLLARGKEKFPSTAPSADPNNAINLMATPSSLVWNEARWGDWNNDGIVTAVDISPIGQYFAKNAVQGDPNYYKYAAYIDGNRSGVVDAGDISPIAFHFGESTGGYYIYQADDSSGTGSQRVAEIARPPVQPDNENPPTNTSLATLQYDTSTGQIDPPGWKPAVTKWYRVVPFDDTPSKEESTTVSSERVELPNHPPVAVLKAIPVSGEAPLSVNLSAEGSTDIDENPLLLKGEWDFTSDGVWDASVKWLGLWNSEAFRYDTPGNYTATFRVTDSFGATAIATVDVSVFGEVWAHSWGGPGYDGPHGCAVDPSGNVYTAGYTGSYAYFGPPDLFLLKYDTSGSLLWAKTWGGWLNDYAKGIACDGSGNVYTVGYTSIGSENGAGFTLKHDTQGNLLWARTWAGSGGENLNSVAVDSNGDLYAAGDTGLGVGEGDVLLLKYDSSGNIQSARTWGGEWVDIAYAVAVDPGFNVYVTGGTNSFGSDSNDVFLLKFDKELNLLWARTCGTLTSDGSTRGESGRGIALDNAGNIYVVGSEVGMAGEDVLLLKYSPDGDLLWARRWGGTSNASGYNVVADTNGKVHILGETVLGAGGGDLLLLRYDADGTLEWAKTWGDYRTQEIVNKGGLAFDANGNLFIVGISPTNRGIWLNVNGDFGSADGITGTPVGTVTSPTGIITYGSGAAESSPLGVIDTGGGREDILILKNFDG